MSVVALITHENQIEQVVAWSEVFAKARAVPLVFACWTHSPVRGMSEPESVSGELVKAVRACVEGKKMAEPPEVIGIDGPSAAAAVIDFGKKKDANLIVAASDDPTGVKGGSYATNPLLKQSPFTTVVLFGDADRSKSADRIFVGASDNIHDAVAAFLGGQVAEKRGADFTLARAEIESGPEGAAIGRRELEQLLRDAGLPRTTKVDKQVFEKGDYEEVTASMNEHDLVLLGANFRRLNGILELAGNPTVGVVKRKPPLRPWQAAKGQSLWSTRLSPADYAELIGGLRRGSKLGADFVTMLSLATVVASLGLLQNSAAVVIGSMLLAPLMTPMIGCGLALAQGNQRLGTAALKTVAAGFLCTLGISFLLGIITPGTELTPQIYARGEPTVLDLIIALAAAGAASYALARPNLVGSIAGVAIATALVPPICSVGISLAYSNFANAQGAALLFVTNFLAIVLGAAVTFRILGITPKYAKFGQKFWIFRVVAIFATAIIIVAVPLQHQLFQSLVETKPQPRTFPLAKIVLDAIEERAEAEPGVRLIMAGAPSSHLATSNVVIVLGATGKADPKLADELAGIVREKMKDDSLVVEVHCVSELWQETSSE